MKLTDVQREEIRLLRSRDRLSHAKIARKIGCAKSTVQDVLSETPPITEDTTDVSQVFTDPADICTLDELLAHCKVDLDEWEVAGFEVNKWAVGMKLEKKDLQFLKGQISGTVQSDGTVVKPLFQVKARLRPRKDAGVMRKFRDELLEQIKTAVDQRIVEPIQYTPIAAGRHLLEVDPFDLHLLKYCWGEETVSDYDLSLASKYFRYAVEDLIAKAAGFGIERVVFVVGNDLMHVDGPSNTTTGGTPMDVDTRFFKGFVRAHELHSWAIRRLVQIAPVDVLIVRGNHDNTAAWHLGHVLATEFGNHPNVTVENGPRLRKYYQYGVNLLGFTHGNEEKESDLPLLMAREVPQLWAATEHREWHKGHIHKYSEVRYKAAESYAGVIVRTLNSLSAHDAWHTKKGYTDRRAMQAFVHNAVTGYVGSFSANVFHDGRIPKEG